MEPQAVVFGVAIGAAAAIIYLKALAPAQPTATDHSLYKQSLKKLPRPNSRPPSMRLDDDEVEAGDEPPTPTTKKDTVELLAAERPPISKNPSLKKMTVGWGKARLAMHAIDAVSHAAPMTSLAAQSKRGFAGGKTWLKAMGKLELIAKATSSMKADLHGLPETALETGSPQEESFHANEIKAEDMRCLALISHNHMKPAMKAFVMEHKDTLLRFRLTGTASTMTMLREVLGDGACFGPTCSSGPLGGDAQVAAQCVSASRSLGLDASSPPHAHAAP